MCTFLVFGLANARILGGVPKGKCWSLLGYHLTVCNLYRYSGSLRSHCNCMQADRMAGVHLASTLALRTKPLQEHAEHTKQGRAKSLAGRGPCTLLLLTVQKPLLLARRVVGGLSQPGLSCSHPVA